MVWRMLDVDYLSVVLISIPATVAYDFCPQHAIFLKAPRQSADVNEPKRLRRALFDPASFSLTNVNGSLRFLVADLNWFWFT